MSLQNAKDSWYQTKQKHGYVCLVLEKWQESADKTLKNGGGGLSMCHVYGRGYASLYVHK